MADEQVFRCHVFVCTNQRPEDDPRGCCHAKGSVRLRNHMKAQAKKLGLRDVRVNLAGCLDRCEHGPSIVVYPEGVWYTATSKADIDEILESHIVGGKPVARLRMPRQGTGDAE